MDRLSRLFRSLARLAGLREGPRSEPCWKLPNVPRDLPAFVRALPKLIPEGGVFYLEGPQGKTPDEIRKLLELNSVDDEAKLSRGILWPPPDIFHVPIREHILAPLADLLANYETPVGKLHLQAYKEGKVLLWGFDAFFDDPFIVSKRVPEENLRAFCDALGCTYKNA